MSLVMTVYDVTDQPVAMAKIKSGWTEDGGDFKNRNKVVVKFLRDFRRPLRGTLHDSKGNAVALRGDVNVSCDGESGDRLILRPGKLVVDNLSVRQYAIMMREAGDGHPA